MLVKMVNHTLLKMELALYVNDNDEVEPDNPSVVIFMKL